MQTETDARFDLIMNKEKTPANICRPTRRFFLSELFGEPEIAAELRREDYIEGDTPLVTNGFVNCGVSDYIGNDVKLYNNHLTIDCFGYCVYRGYDFHASRVYILDNLNWPPDALMYVSVMINAAVRGKFAFTNRFNLSAYNKTSIVLPVNQYGNPDIDYMVKHMRRTRYEAKHIVDYYLKLVEDAG